MPKRGRLGQHPMVHKGFWNSWSAHGVKDRVMAFLAELVAASKLPVSSWHVYITGGNPRWTCVNSAGLSVVVNCQPQISPDLRI